MGGASVFTSGAVWAWTAELAVESDIGAGECAEGDPASGEVDTEAAIGGVAEFDVKVFSGISARKLFGVDMGYSRHRG